ncbi:autophagy-related protein 27 [Crepidotus variabilis]|uniref:Autophagy-related protein 27 n=1 Tax=Crepidotus variabilis TaxID=179855 RepID=A0A9P6EGD9_9AGAR|nr:autophagy-related protein 27 [Crepidotus variabilis]
MIIRSLRTNLNLLLALGFFNSCGLVHALDFDCHVTVNDLKFDLTSMGGEHILNRTRSTPPTTMIDSLRFDLCADLKRMDYLSEHDQCSSNTRVCLTKVNQKDKETDRVTAVIPVAESSSVEVEFTVSNEPKSLTIQFHGGTYAGTSTKQTLNLTVFCDPDKLSDPQFIGYDGSRVDVEWHGPPGCSFAEAPKDGGNEGKEGEKPSEGGGKPPDESVGSGIGWFFLVILIALLTYFGLGAYYKYSTYGASGLDLIPHRDFWKEVPYMLSDVFSHLCASSRPRRAARSGYISV